MIKSVFQKLVINYIKLITNFLKTNLLTISIKYNNFLVDSLSEVIKVYIYREKEIVHPLHIHFLCGNKYNKESTSDKRNVLKNYIDSQDNNYALILEKLFHPKEYRKMGFYDLEEVELMASCYAQSIIILHETVSTAAEIALFGSKKNLRNKVLVVYAPKEIIETDNVGAFIRLAYLRHNKIKSNPYKFNTLLNENANNIRYYETYFQTNSINDDFKEILNEFWGKSKQTFDIKLKKYNVKKSRNNTYNIDNDKKKIYIYLDYFFIKSLLISILLNNELIKDKRNKETIVSEICNIFKSILADTISTNEVKNIDTYQITIKTIDNQDINLPIRFCIYILFNSNLIGSKNGNISITNNFKQKCAEYKALIELQEENEFFEGEYHE